MNIGAGRVVYQELARINKELREVYLPHNLSKGDGGPLPPEH